MTYADVQKSLEIFGLGSRATVKEIKARHRELVRRFHPDAGHDDSEQIRLVNAAYKILLEYIGNYRFSFTEDEFYQQNPDERLRRQFAYDPVWGAKG